MLSRIKIGLPEIRKALLDLNDQTLAVDDLRSISRQLPTSEEVRVIYSFRYPSSPFPGYEAARLW